MTCTPTKVSGKTPIGVISYVFDYGHRRIAISLDEKKMAWSSDYDDVSGIPNYSSSPVNTDYEGKSNTAAWVDHYDSSETNYAPGYCYNYITAGTSKGDWYLPAAGELYGSVWIKKTAVNDALRSIGKTPIMGGLYWSSSEQTHNVVWSVEAGVGNVLANYKTNRDGYVRCVLEI